MGRFDSMVAEREFEVLDRANDVPRRLTQDVAKAVGLVLMRDLLAERRWWSMRELAARLDLDMRTAQRWMQCMEDLGCAVETRRDEDLPGNALRYRGYRG